MYLTIDSLLSSLISASLHGVELSPEVWTILDTAREIVVDRNETRDAARLLSLGDAE